jgi:hypothetical protein
MVAVFVMMLVVDSGDSTINLVSPSSLRRLSHVGCGLADYLCCEDNGYCMNLCRTSKFCNPGKYVLGKHDNSYNDCQYECILSRHLCNTAFKSKSKLTPEMNTKTTLFNSWTDALTRDCAFCNCTSCELDIAGIKAGTVDFSSVLSADSDGKIEIDLTSSSLSGNGKLSVSCGNDDYKFTDYVELCIGGTPPVVTVKQPIVTFPSVLNANFLKSLGG